MSYNDFFRAMDLSIIKNAQTDPNMDLQVQLVNTPGQTLDIGTWKFFTFEKLAPILSKMPGIIEVRAQNTVDKKVYKCIMGQLMY